MATKDFLLPDLGEGLTEGEIVSWLVAVGDTVEVDDPVAEIETAKAVVEVPSPFAGTVTALHGEVGGEVEVGAPLVTIDVDGGARAAPASEEAGEVPAEAEVSDAVPEPEPTADEDESSGNVLVGYGTGARGASKRRRVTAGAPAGGPSAGPAAAAPAPQPVRRDGRPLAKPPVRKLAKDLGVDLGAVPGSGEDGIITREDVEAFHDRQVAGEPREPGVVVTDTEHHRLPSAPPMTYEPVALPQPPEGELEPVRRPLKGIRKAIATQMSRSRAEIPEAVTHVDADATDLMALRGRLNAQHDGIRITPLALILRIVVAGLRRFPEVNASLDTTTEEIVLHRHVNLGVAAQTDRGLVVPVIRGAHRMDVVELAQQLGALTEQARAGKLSPDQMRGSTFSISNYGAFGVDGGDMVINHPEAAILGVGRIADKPWVVDGELAVRKVVNLAIAFDHRVCDGGEAAGFLRFVADRVEDPDLLVASL